ncbi:MAG: hypothetical protein ACOC0N_11950 [Chroococcales cyanobacterium]
MAYWIKVRYERNEYVVDLDRISAFACSPSGRITIWLPDSSTPIILNRQSNLNNYQQVFNYINSLLESSLVSSWARIFYDRCEYIIDLNRLSAFSYSPNKKLTFWLPDSSLPIIVTPQSDPEGFRKLVTFIEKKTGHSFQ